MNNMPTREKIRQLVDADPQISLQALCKATHMRRSSNVRFHLNKLEAEGLIRWQGAPTKKRKISEQVRWQRGIAVLPKMTKAEQAARIEMVAKKALSSQPSVIREMSPNEDVIRALFGHRQLRHLNGVRVG